MELGMGARNGPSVVNPKGKEDFMGGMIAKIPINL